jgi:hypothetical protein
MCALPDIGRTYMTMSHVGLLISHVGDACYRRRFLLQDNEESATSAFLQMARKRVYGKENGRERMGEEGRMSQLSLNVLNMQTATRFSY